MKPSTLAAIFLVPLVALAGAEAVARFGLGLGDPPLTILDKDVEYLFKPGCYKRFGNRVCYNASSMRSDPVPDASGQTQSYLVAGDSVVNGGAQTDQSRTATELAQAALRGAGRDLWIGNLSSGSWGPGNILAYFRTRGWPDVRGLILVLSSHDLKDVPTFPKNLGPDFPLERPRLAVQEAVERYLPKYLPRSLARAPTDRTPAVPQPPDAGLKLYADLLKEARLHVPKVVVLLHPERRELRKGSLPAAGTMRSMAEENGVPIIATESWLSAASDTVYRDNIHPDEAGQAIYGRILACLISHDLDPEPCRRP